MHELLTKGTKTFLPVSKKAAAIFLLITLTFIGSISSSAYAAEHGHTDEMIAANPTVLSLSPFEIVDATSTLTVTDILDIPKPVLNPTPFDLPTLEPSLATFIRKPENILGEDFSQASSRIPTITGMITSAFGWRRHPVRGRVRHHDGVDLAAKLGMPVLAPAAGHVIFSGTKNGYGNVIEIDHENGYVTLLAHHSQLLVNVGDYVDTNTVIAKAGRTGIATGVHVHVEVRFHNALINPKVFLAK